MITTTRLPIGALDPFHAAGVIATPDVHVAAALMRIGGGDLTAAGSPDVPVALGAALCVRALRSGSVCVDLTADPASWTPQGTADLPSDDGPLTSDPGPVTSDLPWPAPHEWQAAAQAHPLVAQGTAGGDDRPLRLVGPLLYLQRYWRDEQDVREAVARRGQLIPHDPDRLREGLARLFPSDSPDQQRLAAACAAVRGLTIVAGGPGTGKTTTVARIISLLRHLDGRRLTIALAAPTGKAAARLQEAVAQEAAALPAAQGELIGRPAASTLHRLLGWRPDSQVRFRHDRHNPLPHDVVIVDETSMVSLPLMARLLAAVRDDARLVLVGDPDQLASIDAGAVLSDLVAAPAQPPGAAGSELAAALAASCPADVTGSAARSGVVQLDHNYRFGRAVAGLADAIRTGDPDAALAFLAGSHEDIEFVAVPDDAVPPGALPPPAADRIRDDVTAQATARHAAAALGDARAALGHLADHRVLCAHREGPHGVARWRDLIQAWTDPGGAGRGVPETEQVGRPLLVTANDYAAGLYNGDTGVIIDQPGLGPRAAFTRGDEIALLPAARLGSVQTLHAMTIHRGQGSQFRSVTVVLPPVGSALLTRELLYTAVTRARERVRIVGSLAAVRTAIDSPVRRASGLRAPTPGDPGPGPGPAG